MGKARAQAAHAGAHAGCKIASLSPDTGCARDAKGTRGNNQLAKSSNLACGTKTAFFWSSSALLLVKAVANAKAVHRTRVALTGSALKISPSWASKAVSMGWAVTTTTSVCAAGRYLVIFFKNNN